ncbi:hypothetical protein F53441_11879 [Fusarium austroafricanum]|uniref:Uncharacterized protein n=1 Tax=Fusarium austroafricanum TaxID=2364996 RepID=A0A8H4K2E3_9HYPO|nr:hypothetical protein F53441_11879 [Fusarium austroafricanum]
MWAPTPAHTPPAFAFEDSDSDFDAEMAMPDYEPMSPVVANLEKMAFKRKADPGEDATNTEDAASADDNSSTKDSASASNSTPPESPIEEFLPRAETPKKPHSHWNSTTEFTLRNGQVYNFGRLQMMSLEVAEARRNGEFPATTEPTLDANAVAEDFNSLMYLRHLRGDIMAPAPQSYVHFREQVALGIQVRQASLRRETDQEVARRVNHYLQVVETEQRYYNATNTMLQHRGVTSSTQQDLANVHDDMCSMVEHTIEQGISDATGPLRLNVSNLKKQSAVFQQQGEVIRQQTGLLQQQNNAFRRQTEQQNNMLQRQTQQQNSLFQLHAEQQNDIFLQQVSLFQNQKATLRDQSRFFKKQTGTLEQQNKIMNTSVTGLNNLIEPQIYNNQVTAQNLATANQLVQNLSTQLPEAIRNAVEEAAHKHSREILEKAVLIQQQAAAKQEHDAQLATAQVKKARKKKAMIGGSDGYERSGRSSLYRMVHKFKRQRISRD